MGGAPVAVDTDATLGVEEEDDSASPAISPPSDLDMTAYLLAVATASLFNSFSDSTLSKTEELSDTIATKPKVKWIATVDQTTCKQLSDGGEGCGTRNNRIYDFDDPELQVHMPGSGTHPYCRCYLETII